MRGKVADREGTLKEHRDALESYVKNCKSLLGLDFAPTDRDSTILQMTAIDPDDREKAFECELSHSAKEGEKQFTGEDYAKIRLRPQWYTGILLLLSYSCQGRKLDLPYICNGKCSTSYLRFLIFLNECNIGCFSYPLQPASSI